MTAIETHYLGPTDKRGSRVKAVALGTKHSTIIEWEDALGPEQNHGRAAKVLIKRMGWDHHAWFGGGGRGGSTVFVCALPGAALTFNNAQGQWQADSPRKESIK